MLSMGDRKHTLGFNKPGEDAGYRVATLSTAGAVCVGGTMLGGLIIPRGRMIAGNDNKRLMPVSCIRSFLPGYRDNISELLPAAKFQRILLKSFSLSVEKTKGGMVK